MSMNPEFRRNLWLEITATRMAGMPLVLLSAIFMAWLADDHSFGSGVSGTSLSLFIAITYLWGMKQTSDSVVGEIRERTWDWQRMSAIGPWSLTWGKFLGSTVYTWYGGAICLPFMLISWAGADFIYNLTSILIFVVGAFVLQGIGLLVSLLMLARDRAISRSESTGIVALAFFVTWPTAGLVMKESSIVWYGMGFRDNDFMLLSLVIFLLWICAGAYSLIRTELRIRTLPYAWCGFVLFFSLYTAGFADTFSTGILAAGCVAMLLTYLTALLDKKDPVAMGRLLRWSREGDPVRVIEGLPAWVCTIPFVLVAAIMLALMPGEHAAASGRGGFAALVLAALAFLARDLGLLLFLNLSQKPQRADMFMLICLALLYGLVPGILQTAGAAPATALFWPRDDFWWISLGASVLGAAAVWSRVVVRWRRLAGGE